MSAFVELLRKSNLDSLITRKTLRIGSRAEEMIFASLIDTKKQQLKFIICLDKSDAVNVWSTYLDERVFQTNARLLEFKELGQTMTFLAERIQESDFLLSKGTATTDSFTVNVSFTNPKNKNSITLELIEQTDEGEKALVLSKILLQLYQRNEELTGEVKRQQLRIKELTTKSSSSSHTGADGTSNRKQDESKNNLTKIQERTQRSLVNPTVKRRKTAKGVTYDSDESD